MMKTALDWLVGKSNKDKYEMMGSDLKTYHISCDSSKENSFNTLTINNFNVQTPRNNFVLQNHHSDNVRSCSNNPWGCSLTPIALYSRKVINPCFHISNNQGSSYSHRKSDILNSPTWEEISFSSEVMSPGIAGRIAKDSRRHSKGFRKYPIGQDKYIRTGVMPNVCLEGQSKPVLIARRPSTSPLLPLTSPTSSFLPSTFSRSFLASTSSRMSDISSVVSVEPHLCALPEVPQEPTSLKAVVAALDQSHVARSGMKRSHYLECDESNKKQRYMSEFESQKSSPASSSIQTMLSSQVGEKRALDLSPPIDMSNKRACKQISPENKKRCILDPHVASLSSSKNIRFFGIGSQSGHETPCSMYDSQKDSDSDSNQSLNSNTSKQTEQSSRHGTPDDMLLLSTAHSRTNSQMEVHPSICCTNSSNTSRTTTPPRPHHSFTLEAHLKDKDRGQQRLNKMLAMLFNEETRIDNAKESGNLPSTPVPFTLQTTVMTSKIEALKTSVTQIANSSTPVTEVTASYTFTQKPSTRILDKINESTSEWQSFKIKESYSSKFENDSKVSSECNKYATSTCTTSSSIGFNLPISVPASPSTIVDHVSIGSFKESDDNGVKLIRNIESKSTTVPSADNDNSKKVSLKEISTTSQDTAIPLAIHSLFTFGTGTFNLTSSNLSSANNISTTTLPPILDFLKPNSSLSSNLKTSCISQTSLQSSTLSSFSFSNAITNSSAAKPTTVPSTTLENVLGIIKPADINVSTSVKSSTAINVAGDSNSNTKSLFTFGAVSVNSTFETDKADSNKAIFTFGNVPSSSTFSFQSSTLSINSATSEVIKPSTAPTQNNKFTFGSTVIANPSALNVSSVQNPSIFTSSVSKDLPSFDSGVNKDTLLFGFSGSKDPPILAASVKNSSAFGNICRNPSSSVDLVKQSTSFGGLISDDQLSDRDLVKPSTSFIGTLSKDTRSFRDSVKLCASFEGIINKDPPSFEDSVKQSPSFGGIISKDLPLFRAPVADSVSFGASISKPPPSFVASVSNSSVFGGLISKDTPSFGASITSTPHPFCNTRSDLQSSKPSISGFSFSSASSGGFTFGATKSVSTSMTTTQSSVFSFGSMTNNKSSAPSQSTSSSVSFNSASTPSTTLPSFGSSGGFSFGKTAEKIAVASINHLPTSSAPSIFTFGSSSASNPSTGFRFAGANPGDSQPVASGLFTFGNVPTPVSTEPSPFVGTFTPPAAPTSAQTFGSVEPASPLSPFIFGNSSKNISLPFGKRSSPQNFGALLAFGNPPSTQSTNFFGQQPPISTALTFGQTASTITQMSTFGAQTPTFSFGSNDKASSAGFPFGTSLSHAPSFPFNQQLPAAASPQVGLFQFGQPGTPAAPNFSAGTCPDAMPRRPRARAHRRR